jgi:hypothetical protein
MQSSSRLKIAQNTLGIFFLINRQGKALPSFEKKSIWIIPFGHHILLVPIINRVFLWSPNPGYNKSAA